MSARILLVEDDAIVALDARRIVEDLGHEVVAVCGTAEDALERAAASAPDLALVDIRLRGPMDGVTLAEELYVCTGLPVVFVSAHSDGTTLARASHVGAYGFVTKPFTPGALASALTMALAKHAEVRRTSGLAELQRLALNQTAAAVVVTRDDGTMRFINRAAAHLLGQPALRLVGQPIATVLADVDGWLGELGDRPPTLVPRVDPATGGPVWVIMKRAPLSALEAGAVWTLSERVPN